MTYVRVWRFRPVPSRVAAFEEAYGPEGDWARRFYQTFRRARNEEFLALDRACEALTAMEEELGEYEASGQAPG